MSNKKETLTEWIARVPREVRSGRIYLGPAALRTICNPKKALSKTAYVKAVKSFLKAYKLEEELAVFTAITAAKLM